MCLKASAFASKVQALALEGPGLGLCLEGPGLGLCLEGPGLGLGLGLGCQILALTTSVVNDEMNYIV